MCVGRQSIAKLNPLNRMAKLFPFRGVGVDGGGLAGMEGG